ncbi:hypothetical protein EGP98_03425 [bacterium]|nr:hypothetical protein [bacterium]
MKQRKKEYISILAVLVLIITIIGISYAAFIYIGTGKTLNTITTGAISMSYEESSNVISMDKALPTTDATGKKQLKTGEYFDFTVAGNIVGGETINWEITAEDVTSSTKKIDGSHIKLYLTSVNSSGVETEVMAPTTYKSLIEANNDTGRPANQMSLATGTTDTSFSTKYRLRMYVDESYNPQGDGGDLSFAVKVNVYGKSKAKPTTGAENLVAKANPETLDYNTATADQKNQMWTFPHEATEQLKATTDYRYIGANPNNYVKFNDELWRIIGVFDVDDGTGKIEKRMKIIRNESIGNYSWDNKNTSNGAETDYGKNNWSDARLNYLLNSGHESETYGGSLYWNRKSGICHYGSGDAITSCNFTSTGLTDEAKSMIGDAKWYLGGISTSEDLTLPMFYTRERGTTVYNNSSSTNWTGKVGLMYPSDYGYATSGGNSTNRASCMEKELYRWNDSSYSDCKKNDWLYNSSQKQWTMSPRTNDSRTVSYVYKAGQVSNDYAYDANAVRPVVHLKSTIKITGGTGSSTDPFILG